MVKLFRGDSHQDDPTSISPIARLIEEHRDLCEAKQLVVDVDLEGENPSRSNEHGGLRVVHGSPAGRLSAFSTTGMEWNAGVEDSVRRVLRRAIERCPKNGELTITSIRTERGLEVEIADSGHIPSTGEAGQWVAWNPTPQDMGHVRDRITAVQSNSCDIFCAKCPQGGLAWTIVLRPRVANLKAA